MAGALEVAPRPPFRSTLDLLSVSLARLQLIGFLTQILGDRVVESVFPVACTPGDVWGKLVQFVDLAQP